jgi:hypothetical protein
VLGVLALVVVAMNAYALLLLLPSLHAWLWLPQIRDRPLWLRLVVLALGLAGPLLLLASFARGTSPRSSRSATSPCLPSSQRSCGSRPRHSSSP